MGNSIRRTTTAAALALGCLTITGPALGLTTTHSTAPTHGAVSPDRVPNGFKANSLSWLSPQRGFVLGTGRCSGSRCARVIGTLDAGSTWKVVGYVPTPVVKSGRHRSGVAEVRFGTRQIGWAFAPQLWMTTDGGASWAQQSLPGNGQQVLDLAAGPHATYMVVSQCRYQRGNCGKPLTLWRSPNREPGTWLQVHVDLPSNYVADVSVNGTTVYVIDEQLEAGTPAKFYVSTDGRTFNPLTSPCDHSQDLALVQAVPTSATDVDVLCVGDPGMSEAVKSVYRSADNGATFTSAGKTGFDGIQSQLAASPSGNLAVTSESDGSFIYINDGGGTHWDMPVAKGDGGAGWNDITYVNDKTAWVVYAPAAFPVGTGLLYVTHDAGQSWSSVTL